MSAPALLRRDRLDAYAVSVMIGLTFTWGVNQVLIKVANAGFNPLAVATARALLAAAAVWAWCRWRRVPLDLADGTLGPGVLAGLLFGLEFIAIYVGLDYTSAARGVLLINTMPFFVALGAHFLLGERITGAKLAGMVMAFGGVALVFSDELSLPTPSALVGDALMLAAAAFWGATTLLIKRSALTSAAPEKVLLYQLVVSGLLTLPLVPMAGPVLRGGGALATGSVLFQALFVVAFTYVLWFQLVRRYPASALSNFAFLSPVFGVLAGGLLLDEPLSWKIFAALAAIGGGLAIANRPVRT